MTDGHLLFETCHGRIASITLFYKLKAQKILPNSSLCLLSPVKIAGVTGIFFMQVRSRCKPCSTGLLSLLAPVVEPPIRPPEHGAVTRLHTVQLAS